jgi:hypothetical protein
MIISICKLLEKMFIGLYVLFFLVCIYFHLIDNAFDIFYNLKGKLIDFIVFLLLCLIYDHVGAATLTLL